MTQDLSSLIDNGTLLQKYDADNKTKIKNFQKIIDEIDSIDDKKKELWKEIYANAIEDRQNAYMMFVKLVHIVQNTSSEHAIHSRTIASFLERMNKANDQLLKLADLIARSQQQNDIIDTDDMFEKIGNG